MCRNLLSVANREALHLLHMTHYLWLVTQRETVLVAPVTVVMGTLVKQNFPNSFPPQIICLHAFRAIFLLPVLSLCFHTTSLHSIHRIL